MTTLGTRVRELRRTRGLSQAQLVDGLPLAPSYVSLIERDLRQPSDQVLTVVASRLGCTPDYLRTGRRGPSVRDLELELRFAEVALHSGDPATARDRFAAVAERARELHHDDVEQDARWGLSRAEEGLGNLGAAIELLESLHREPLLKGSFTALALARRLAHTHLDAGDVARATEVAEAAMAEADQDGRPDLDERTELASTLVACYYERGDLGRAHSLAQRVLDETEHSSSPRARAAAFWEAALVAEARGELRQARIYTERALALYTEINNTRAVGILRHNVAWLKLRLPEHDSAEVECLLRSAIAELVETGSPVDVARAETELARCLLLRGEPAVARAAAASAYDRLGASDQAPAARALTILASASLIENRRDEALQLLERATQTLTAAEPSRDVAVVWRELGDVLAVADRATPAIMAYQRAADALGIVAAPMLPPSLRPGTTMPGRPSGS